jgi:hypothetical protein
MKRGLEARPGEGSRRGELRRELEARRGQDARRGLQARLIKGLMRGLEALRGLMRRGGG